MNPRALKPNADAQAREAMLREMIQTRREGQGEGASKPETHGNAKRDIEGIAESVTPIQTRVFDEVHAALESLRGKPQAWRELAVTQLVAAHEAFRAGKLGRAMRMLDSLREEIAGNRWRPAERSINREHWMSEEIVVQFGVA